MPKTVAVPVATPVKVTGQVPAAVKTQLPPTVPTAVLDDVNVTVPDGVLDGVVESVTVAVQVEVPVGMIVEGLQDTAVDVASLATVIVLEAVGPLPL